MPESQISKISIVGNAGGGKTTLSRSLAQIYQLPLTHVDSIQFLPGMTIRPQEETRRTLLEVSAQNKWLIDGFGPLDLIEQRFQLADRVIFVDFPLWRHSWWCAKRQIRSLWRKREELPEGCFEGTWSHTLKLYKTLFKVHKLMRPELIRILEREKLKNKVLFVRSLKQWNLVFNGMLGDKN
jgi:adenylate kinase family enzyme